MKELPKKAYRQPVLSVKLVENGDIVRTSYSTEPVGCDYIVKPTANFWGECAE